MSVRELVNDALEDKIEQLRTNFAFEVAGKLYEKMEERKQEIAKVYFGQGKSK